MRNQVEKEVQSFIRPFIELSRLQGVQFPLLPITYTLWRKICYKQLQQKYKYQTNSSEHRQLKRAFIQVSQRTLLPMFLQKVQSQIDGKSVGWKRAIQQADDLKMIDSEQYQQLLFQYCESLYQLQFYIEMFYDLVSIPYSDIFDKDKKYLTNENLKSNLYSKKSQTLIDKACQKIGKNIISKGLGKISEALLSGRILYGMTGVLGAFNPLAFAASFSISYAMDSHEKSSKEKNVISQLKFLQSSISKNINELKQNYDRCLASIQVMAQLDSSQTQLLQREKKKFFGVLSKVLKEDWLQIKVTKQGEWEIIQLKDKYDIETFQHIQLPLSQDQQIKDEIF